jgi:hypothetical protein
MMTTKIASDGTIRLDLTKRQTTEIWCSEYDTAYDPGCSDEHNLLADQLKAGTDLPNRGLRVALTPETLLYLAENIHYHIDRTASNLGSTSPKYDWDNWSSLGADLAALKGLDQRVKRMCRELGLRYKVWSFTKGMHYAD